MRKAPLNAWVTITLLTLSFAAHAQTKSSPEEFLTAHSADFKEGDAERIRGWVQKHFGDLAALDCTFTNQMKQGDYTEDQTRVELLQNLNSSGAIYFGFQESGTKETRTNQVPVRLRDSHPTLEGLHQLWSAERQNGLRRDSGCVSDDGLYQLGVSKRELNAFLISEGIDISQVTYQRERCPLPNYADEESRNSRDAPRNVLFGFNRVKDATLFSSHYQYFTLAIDCQNKQKAHKPFTMEAIEVK